MINAALKKIIDEKYHRSNSELALKLWKTIPEEKKKTLNVKSLATKIGELVNCKDESRIGWWRKAGGGTYLEFLSELTGLGPEALLSPTEKQIGFPEFPELATWRPQEGDALCPIWYETSQNFQPRPPSTLLDIVVKHLSEETSGLLWIVVPPGCGKATTLRAMEILHSDEVTVSEHLYLSEMTLPNEGQLTFGVIHRQEQNNDWKFQQFFQQLLRRKTSTVILAPFAAPNRSGERKFGEKNPSLAKDWCTQLVKWAAERYVRLYKSAQWPKSLTEAIIGLCQSDLKEFIVSPGDVLSLCRQCQKELVDIDGGSIDIEDFDVAELAANWLKEVAFPQDDDSESQIKLYNKAVYSLLLNRDVEWNKLRAGDWKKFLEEPLFDKISFKSGEKKDERIASPKLLKYGVCGMQPYPNWVAAGTLMPPAEEGQKEYFFEPNNIRQWAWTGADNSRKNLLLSLMKNCRSEIIKINIQKSLEGLGQFERLAAIETFVRFAADDPQSINSKFCNSILWEEFFKNLDAFGHPLRDMPEEKFHFPLTWEQRYPAVGEISDSMNFNSSEMIREFLQVGWGLSHQYSDCENAKAALPEQYAWIFPFWTKKPLGLDSIPFESFYWPTSDQFFQWAKELIDSGDSGKVTLPKETDADNIPAIFLPAFLLSDKYLTSLGQKKNRPFAEYIMQKIQAESAAWLGKQLNSDEIEPDIRQRCVEVIWQNVSGVSVVEKIGNLCSNYPSLAEIVLKNISEEVLRKTVRDGGIRPKTTGNPNLLNALDEPKRIGVLMAWLETADANAAETAFDAYAFSPLFTRSLWREIQRSGQIKNISKWLRRMPRIVIGPIARQLWKEDADWAMEEIKKWISEPTFRDEGLQEWFCVAPREQFGALAEVLKSAAPRPIWTKKWCRIAIGRAGSAAETLFELM